jgi:uncharacterized protein YqeY
MLIDDIKKANVEAMKAHDAAAHSVFSLAIAKYLELKTNGSGQEVTDADVLAIVTKLDKELDEEKEGYEKAGRAESVKELIAQKAALKRFIPVLMSEEAIKKIIAELPDKSVPAVMKHFKTNYAGKADLSLVSKIARGL